MMRDNGFEKIGGALYCHAGEQLIVYDLFPRNVKVSRKQGTLHPLDSVILRAPPVFADFLKSNIWILEETSPARNGLQYLGEGGNGCGSIAVGSVNERGGGGSWSSSSGLIHPRP